MVIVKFSDVNVEETTKTYGGVKIGIFSGNIGVGLDNSGTSKGTGGGTKGGTVRGTGGKTGGK